MFRYYLLIYAKNERIHTLDNWSSNHIPKISYTTSDSYKLN